MDLHKNHETMTHCPNAPLIDPDDYISEEEYEAQYDAELEEYELFHDK